MRIEETKFGIRTKKTLRRVNPSMKMKENEGVIMSKLLKDHSIPSSQIYHEECLVQTNEDFEQVDKADKKRVLKNKKVKKQTTLEPTSEEEKNVSESTIDEEDEFVEEYTHKEYHQLRADLDKLYG